MVTNADNARLIYGPPEFKIHEIPDVASLLARLGFCDANITEYYPPSGFYQDGSRNEAEPVTPRAFLEVRVFDKQGRYLGPIGCIISNEAFKGVSEVDQARADQRKADAAKVRELSRLMLKAAIFPDTSSILVRTAETALEELAQQIENGE